MKRLEIIKELYRTAVLLQQEAKLNYNDNEKEYKREIDIIYLFFIDAINRVKELFSIDEDLDESLLEALNQLYNHNQIIVYTIRKLKQRESNES
ncbi:hypothetical protein [Desulfofustis phage LS06-2018-MD01]|jgi:hypothetical protein|nr:hypothetical protein [Desulfofustis phage LS06-2018-MD01]